MEKVVIVDGIRTPFCKMGTSLNDVSAQELGRIVTRELLERTQLNPAAVEEVIFGSVAQPPEAANISRVIALLSGIPKTTPAFTVHRNCASGLEAVATATLKIQSGEVNCIVAGGTESMSNIPFFLTKELQEIIAQFGKSKTFIEKLKTLSRFRLKFLTPKVGLLLGLTDPVCGLNMGQTAEVLVKEFGITRDMQDGFALMSHQRAVASRGILREEIVPVLPAPRYKEIL